MIWSEYKNKVSLKKERNKSIFKWHTPRMLFRGVPEMVVKKKEKKKRFYSEKVEWILL